MEEQAEEKKDLKMKVVYNDKRLNQLRKKEIRRIKNLKRILEKILERKLKKTMKKQ